MRRLALAFAITAFAFAATGACEAAGPVATVTVILKNHRFSPSMIPAPPGQKLRIRLINQDAAGEEFDSRDLDVEEDVTPYGQTSFEIGPLKPGRYSFMGEFHAQTAEGEVVVTAAAP